MNSEKKERCCAHSVMHFCNFLGLSGPCVLILLPAYEELKMREVEGRSGSQMIEQPSGSADNDVYQTGTTERGRVSCGKRGRRTRERRRGKR